jgi:hypothetical protein
VGKDGRFCSVGKAGPSFPSGSNSDAVSCGLKLSARTMLHRCISRLCKGAPLAVADQQAVAALSAQVLTAAFIANVPSIVSR